MDRLTGVSKILRKNMSGEERHLWYDFLKDLPLTVNRQKVLGRYIVDFFIASKKTVIELDGSQHFQGEGPERDRVRDQWFQANGITVWGKASGSTNPKAFLLMGKGDRLRWMR